METGKIIPEDALNLELKYLDENIRPFLLAMDEAYRDFILTGKGSAKIVANALTAIHAINRIDRLDVKEIEDLRKKFVRAKDIPSGNPEFWDAIVDAMDSLGRKIGSVSLYSRVGEGRKRSIFSEPTKDKEIDDEED